MLNKRVLILAAACSFLSISALAETTADEDGVLEERQCIRTRDIRRTEVIHDRAIIFHMRGSSIYVNVLPTACKRLSRSRRFMYETSAARLCKFDHIKILRDAGFGLEPGRSCKIGIFYGISAEDVERLKQPLDINPEPVPPADPEDPQTVEPDTTPGSSEESR